jgi:hypothetical protein
MVDQFWENFKTYAVLGSREWGQYGLVNGKLETTSIGSGERFKKHDIQGLYLFPTPFPQKLKTPLQSMKRGLYILAMARAIWG